MAPKIKPQSRAVGPDEAPESLPIDSVFEAAEHGSLLDELVQMRRVTARRIDDPTTPAPALAAIMKQHRELAESIKSIRRQEAEEDAEDDVTADEEWSEEAI